MKKSYFKKYSQEGDVYSQTITLNKELLPFINKRIALAREEAKKTKDISIIMYLHSLKEGENFTNLTTRNFVLLECLNVNDFLDRNTILKFV